MDKVIPVDEMAKALGEEVTKTRFLSRLLQDAEQQIADLNKENQTLRAELEAVGKEVKDDL